MKEITITLREKEMSEILNPYLSHIGVDVLESQYHLPNGKIIDALGITPDNRPVIIEYKMSKNRSLLTQLQAYCQELGRYESAFRDLLKKKKLAKRASKLDWDIRAIGIAPEFDEMVLAVCPDGVELIECDLLKNPSITLEWIKGGPPKRRSAKPLKPVKELMKKPRAKELGKKLEQAAKSCGKDVVKNYLQRYVGFKTKEKVHFAAFAPFRGGEYFKIWFKIKPGKSSGFDPEDLSNKGHPAPGHFQIIIKDERDVKRAKPLFLKAYKEAKRK